MNAQQTFVLSGAERSRRAFRTAVLPAPFDFAQDERILAHSTED